MLKISRYTIHLCSKVSRSMRPVLNVSVLDLSECTEGYDLDEYDEFIHLMKLLGILPEYYDSDDIRVHVL